MSTNRLDQLDLRLERLHMELAALERAKILSSMEEKVRLEQLIKALKKEIQAVEAEYWQTVANSANQLDIPEAEAEVAVGEIVEAVTQLETRPVPPYPDEMLQILRDIRDQLNQPGSPAAAKLKGVISSVPPFLSLSYEAELDTENFFRTHFPTFTRLIKRTAKDASPSQLLERLRRSKAVRVSTKGDLAASPSQPIERRSKRLRRVRVSTKGRLVASVALRRSTLTHASLAEVTGLSRATVSKFFKGDPVTLSIAIKLCEALGLDWEAIIEEVEPVSVSLELKTANDANFRVPNGFQLKYVLRCHQGLITRISWSPSGRLLAAPSTDGTICIWEKGSGQLYKSLKDDSTPVFAVAWSPDSKSLAAASDDCIVRIWDVKTGKLRQKFEGCTDIAFDVTWSPSGQTVAFGLRDGTIQQWNTTTWELRNTLRGHADVVWVVKYSPDGHTLASGSKDKTIRLWNSESGEAHSLLQGHTNDISSLSWLPNGKKLASAGSHDASIRIWDVETGQQTNILEGHTKSISSISFSADSQLLASKSEDGTVQIWHGGTWTRAAILDEPMDSNMLRGLAFHPKEPLLATLNQGNATIRVWDLLLLTALSSVMTLAKTISLEKEKAEKETENHKNIRQYIDLIEILDIEPGSKFESLLLEKYKQLFEKFGFVKFNSTVDYRDYEKQLEEEKKRLEKENKQLEEYNKRLEEIFNTIKALRALRLTTVQYTTAKIVLVGESNVGKSCLGLRLAEDRYEEQGTTHGMRFWTIDPQQLSSEATIP